MGLDFYGSIDQDRALFYQEIAALVVTSAAGGVPDAPAAPRLLANHPNPFNPRTALNFELAAPQEVILEIFDPGGRLIDALDLGVCSAGQHQVFWNADAVSAGVYLCRLSAGSSTDTRKLTLIK